MSTTIDHVFIDHTPRTLDVGFRAKTTPGEGLKVRSFRWSYKGMGHTDSFRTKTPVIRFPKDGEYEIRLEVKDSADKYTIEKFLLSVNRHRAYRKTQTKKTFTLQQLQEDILETEGIKVAFKPPKSARVARLYREAYTTRLYSQRAQASVQELLERIDKLLPPTSTVGITVFDAAGVVVGDSERSLHSLTNLEGS